MIMNNIISIDNYIKTGKKTKKNLHNMN